MKTNETISAKKIYLLDAAILTQAPYSLHAFDDNTVIISDTVIAELDGYKLKAGEIGANSIQAIRNIHDLLEKSVVSEQALDRDDDTNHSIFSKIEREAKANGSLASAVQLETGGQIVFITSRYDAVSSSENKERPYSSYIQILTYLKDYSVILVSQNIAMRATVRALGFASQPYKSNTVLFSDEARYEGRRTLLVRSEDMDNFYKDKTLPIAFNREDEAPLVDNEYIILKSSEQDSTSAVGRFDYASQSIIKIKLPNEVYGVKPLNVGQKFALDALLLPVEECPLTILMGRAGTAKTFLSLAAGLQQVMDSEPKYRRILVARPNVKFDETIGFLKGGEEEKIGPLIRPIMDNLDHLTAIKSEPQYISVKKGKGKNNRFAGEENDKIVAPNSYAQDLFDSGKIVAQAMEYMRGRSICDTFLIIDEAQNMTPEQAFGIISRAGKGTKVVLVGDPEQIDNPRLDRNNNGLTWASEKMKGSSLCVQLTFSAHECERSPLAAEATKRLSTKGHSVLLENEAITEEK